MKKYLLSGCLITFAAIAYAQQNPPAFQDTHFKFDHKITDAENRWVIFPKSANSTEYPYGVIYMDQQAGFTFDLQGLFAINANGNYLVDTAFAAKAKYHAMKYRLNADSRTVAFVSPEHFKELNIVAEPEWLKSYKSAYVDNAAHNYRLGYIYNGAGDSEKALTYLNKAENEDANYKGLAFEIIFAYNALKRFPEAEKFAAKAILRDKTNLLLYRELGYAYLGESNLPKAIEAMKSGLENCVNANNNDKAETAFNLAKAYNMSGDKENYKIWGVKAKDWANPNTQLYNALSSMGF